MDDRRRDRAVHRRAPRERARRARRLRRRGRGLRDGQASSASSSILLRIDAASSRRSRGRHGATPAGVALNAAIATLSLRSGWCVAPAPSRCPRPPRAPISPGQGRGCSSCSAELRCRSLSRRSTSSAFRFAAREGVGSVTSFGYAYLLAAGVVGVTASSLGLVTSVPLTRVGLDPARRRAPRRCVVLARARRRGRDGGRLRASRAPRSSSGCSGSSYGADVGSQIGRLVVALAPFMVVSVALSVTLPARLRRAARRASCRSSHCVVARSCTCPLAIVGQVVAGLVGPGDRARGVYRARARVVCSSFSMRSERRSATCSPRYSSSARWRRSASPSARGCSARPRRRRSPSSSTPEQ